MSVLTTVRSPFVWKDQENYWFARVWSDGQADSYERAQKAIRVALVARDLIGIDQVPQIRRTEHNDEFSEFGTRQPFKRPRLTPNRIHGLSIGDEVHDTYTGFSGTLVGFSSLGQPIIYTESYNTGWFTTSEINRLRPAEPLEMPRIRYPRVGDIVELRRNYGGRTYPGLRDGLVMTVTRSLESDLRYTDVVARSRTGRSEHVFDVRDLRILESRH